MFWNKTLLKWEEPGFAKAYISKQVRVKDYLQSFGKVAVKLFIGSYIVFWILGWQRSLNPILSFDLLIIASVIVGFYFLIWLMTLLGSKVSKSQVYLREKNFTYISLDGTLIIPYKKMKNFSLIEASLEEKKYFILQINDWDGNENFFEIEPKINNASIIEILKSKNINETVSTLPLLKV